MNYYRISITGYGSEQTCAKISMDQCRYWRDIKKRYYDYDNEDEQANSIWESLSWDHDENPDIPAYAKFGPESVHEWGENVFQHWGAFITGSQLNVDQVDSLEWDSKIIKEIGEWDLYADEFLEEDEHFAFGKTEFGENDETYPSDSPDPVVYYIQVEKGSFFDGTFVTKTEFDPKKLSFALEDIDGEYKISGIKYDGVEIDNVGGDTRSKSEDYFFMMNE